MEKNSVSVVIPTYNAAPEIALLLDRLISQREKLNEILVIDSSSSDNTVEIAKTYPLVKIELISKIDFDHGGTRNFALKKTTGDFILFLTQDAIPKDDTYIENLLSPFIDDRVAMSYGRQIPKENATRFVQLVQEYNYPDESEVRDRSSVDLMGIKAYFCSDSCSAYRRSALQEIGGIPHPCSTNEDMLAASRFLNSGYKVAYCASAEVFHSHNLGLIKQYKRNKAIGEFLQTHKDELDVDSEIGEGGKLVFYVLNRLRMENNYFQMVSFLLDCVARFLGNRIGRINGQGKPRED